MVIVVNLKNIVPISCFFHENFAQKLKNAGFSINFFSQKLRTYSVEALFGHNIKNIQKCWNPKNLRIFEAQPIFTGSYKKSVLLVKPYW